MTLEAHHIQILRLRNGKLSLAEARDLAKAMDGIQEECDAFEAIQVVWSSLIQLRTQ